MTACFRLLTGKFRITMEMPANFYDLGNRGKGDPLYLFLHELTFYKACKVTYLA